MYRRRWVLALAGSVVLALAVILISPLSAAGQDGWTWQNPLPQGNNLNGIWGSSAGNIFAVGDAGTIIHSDGTAWSTMSSSITGTLRDVWGSSATNVFAVGEGGTIARYDGTAWIAMSGGVTNTLNSVWGSSGSDVFAVGEAGTILHYDGAGWSPMAGGGGSLVGVWGNSGSDVFAIAATGAVLHYDGASWNTVPTDTSAVSASITAIWGSSEGIVAATDGWGSPILRYTGTAWESIGSFGPAYGIWGTSAADIFVVGYNGELEHFNGSDWTYTPTGSPGLNAVWGSGSNNVFAVGLSGTILHYDGTSWTNISSVTNKFLYDIWGSSGTDVFAVGEGTILHYDGAAWSPMVGGSGGAAGVWGSNGNDVFAVGGADAVLHYDGNSWTAMNTGLQFALREVWGSSGQDVFAAGTGGRIAHYDGVQWSEMSGGPHAESIAAIWGSSGSDVYAVGNIWEYGAIFHYDGKIWSDVTPYSMISPFSAVWGSSSSDVYAVADRVLHYDGVKWEGVAIPREWQYYNFTAVWGSGSDDVFVAGSAYGWWSTPPFTLPANLHAVWHFDGTAWTAMPFPTSAPSAGWANSKTDVFAVGDLSILHYAGAPPQLLTVAKTGHGSGTVSSTPAGIACGATCSAVFSKGITVSLTTGADVGSIFAGWSGACTGTGACTVTMDSGKAVTATFGVEGEVAPQGSTMYYGPQLQVRQGIAASAAPTAAQLAIFTGAPPGVYLVGVAGTVPYAGPLSAFRLVNTLLLGGCAGGPCAAVNCAYFSPEGKRTDLVVTKLIMTDHAYLPFMRRR